METKALTPEELQAKVNELEDSRNYWMDRSNKVEKKFSAFRDMVKGLIVLID